MVMLLIAIAGLVLSLCLDYDKGLVPSVYLLGISLGFSITGSPFDYGGESGPFN